MLGHLLSIFYSLAYWAELYALDLRFTLVLHINIRMRFCNNNKKRQNQEF